MPSAGVAAIVCGGDESALQACYEANIALGRAGAFGRIQVLAGAKPRTMVDPTSDLGEDVDEETAPACATCGEKIVRQPSHRVVTWVDDEGMVQHRHFCDDECKAAFEA